MSNIPKPDNDNAVIAELMREIKEMRSQLAQVQNVNNTGGQGVVSNSQNVLANNLATDKNKERAYSEQSLQTTAQEAIERAHQDQISRNKFSAHVDGNLVASMMMQMPVTTFSGMNLVAYPIGISLPFGGKLYTYTWKNSKELVQVLGIHVKQVRAWMRRLVEQDQETVRTLDPNDHDVTNRVIPSQGNIY
jgi:hypothetical protein